MFYTPNRYNLCFLNDVFLAEYREITMVLENAIIERLKQCLNKNIYILNIEPFSTSSTIEQNYAMSSAAALQPIPAVHVLERDFKINNQVSSSLLHNKKCASVTFTKSVWVIIVVKNTYNLKNAGDARYEIELIRRPVFSALSYWNPETPPFVTPLMWDTSEVEIFYENSIGIAHCPLIIRARPFVENYELYP